MPRKVLLKEEGASISYRVLLAIAVGVLVFCFLYMQGILTAICAGLGGWILIAAMGGDQNNGQSSH